MSSQKLRRRPGKGQNHGDFLNRGSSGQVGLMARAIGLALAMGLVAMLAPAGAQAQTETVLHSFAGPSTGGTGADGALPYEGLVMDSSGNFFGTTDQGGDYGYGTVYELVNSSGTYTEKILYSFSDANGDGANPFYCKLVMDSSGNLFGTTEAGGTDGMGTVFEMVNSSGTYTEKVLYSFLNSNNDGQFPYAGLVMDSSGNLFGTTAFGGTDLAGTVFELVKSSGTYTEKILYTFTGLNGDGSQPYAGLLMDNSGNLFGTTYAGGANTEGTVFELVNSSGNYTEKVLYSFASSGGDAHTPQTGLVMDASGDLFGTTTFGGAQPHVGTVYELVYSSGSGTYTEKVLYSFTDANGDGADPFSGLITDASGNLYGTTEAGGASFQGTVFEMVNSSGNYTEKVLYSFTGTNGDATPYSTLTMDSSGNLYGTTSGVGVSGNGTVFEIQSGPGVPVASLSASQLDFGSVNEGSTSVAQTITMTNIGSGDLTFVAGAVTISGTDHSDFSISADSCSGATISPTSTCSVSVVFTPSTGSSESALLNFADNASGSPQSAHLIGTGVAATPTVTLSPASLTFSSQTMGTTSTAQLVTLTNSGSVSLSITGIAVTANFAETDTCGASVAAGSNCTISVTFVPTAAGPLTGTLSVMDNASNSPQTVSLSGTGVAAPAVTLSPASLIFSSQVVGTTSAAMAITLTNSGGANLIFGAGAVTLSGTNAADFAVSADTCSGQTVAPTSTCSVGVTFKPSIGGSESAALSIADNAPNSPQAESLSGTGVASDFSLAVNGSSSATVSAGNSASYSLNIVPSGGFNQAVTLTCTGAPSKATCNVTPSSLTLDGSTTATASVSVATTASSAVPPAPYLPTIPRGWLGLILLCLLAFLLAVRRRLAQAPSANWKHAPWRPVAATAGLLLAIALMASCGGGGGSVQTQTIPGTPAGTYTLTVTGTSGSLSHAVTLNLTVQ